MCDGTRDVAQRVSALARRIDDRDPHWTVDFSRTGSTVVQTVRAKHPRAHQVSPISVHVHGSSRSLDPELSAALMRVVGFGAPEEVVLPASAVERLTVEGPEWLSQTLEHVEVAWMPASPDAGAGTEAEIVFLPGQETKGSSYSGQVRHLGEGSLGRSLAIDVCGARLQVLDPHSGTVQARLSLSFELEGSTTQDALRVLSLYRRFLLGGPFRLLIDGRVAAEGEVPPSAGPDELEALAQLYLYVEDLDVVQRHCEQYFPLPAGIPAGERIMLRVARLLADGHCVVSPCHTSVTITLSGQDHPALRSLLAGQAPAVRTGGPQFEFTVAGRTLDLGAAACFHTAVLADHPQDVLAALEAGTAAGKNVTVRPADGEHYRFYLSELPGPDELHALLPHPLGLAGYREPR